MSKHHHHHKDEPEFPIHKDTNAEEIKRMERQFSVLLNHPKRADRCVEIITLLRSMHGPGETEEHKQALFRCILTAWISGSVTELVGFPNNNLVLKPLKLIPGRADILAFAHERDDG